VNNDGSPSSPGKASEAVPFFVKGNGGKAGVQRTSAGRRRYSRFFLWRALQQEWWMIT
jgi:hypothetical protein